MRRDWDVIRQIMLNLEDAESVITTLTPEAVEGYPRNLVCYNMVLLKEAELAEGSVLRGMGNDPDCVLLRLTFAGHELLDQIRPKPMWEKIKSYVKKHGMELSLEAVRTAAAIVARTGLDG